MLSDGTAAALGHGEDEKRKERRRYGTVERKPWRRSILTRDRQHVYLIKKKKTKYSSITRFSSFIPPVRNN